MNENDEKLANEIAVYLQSTYYPHDVARLDHFKRGLLLLKGASQFWTPNTAATPEICNQMMSYIHSAQMEDQLGLCCLIIHCIGDDEWHQRSIADDKEYYSDAKKNILIHPVVWMFKIKPKDLMSIGSREEYGYVSEGSMFGLLRTEQNYWRIAVGNGDNDDQESCLKHFVADLKIWCPR